MNAPLLNQATDFHASEAATRETVCALYRANSKQLLQLLGRLAPPGVDPSDLLQDVFVIALRRAGTLLKVDSPRAWLYGVALKIAAEARRRPARRRQLPLDSAEAVTTVETPASAYERCEQVGRLHRALGCIPSAKRELVVMFDIEERTGVEIAQHLNCSVSRVWSRLHHARRCLEAALEQPE